MTHALPPDGLPSGPVMFVAEVIAEAIGEQTAIQDERNGVWWIAGGVTPRSAGCTLNLRDVAEAVLVNLPDCGYGPKPISPQLPEARRLMAAYQTPQREGHFWAKLKLADNSDHNSMNWEVVQVFENIARPWCEADIETGECLMVHVPGIERSQPVDAFVWGPPVHKPEDLK